MKTLNLSVMLDQTVDGLVAALKHQMPDAPYRDFYEWCFSADNPNRYQWAQTTGLTQLVVLTIKLYEQLVSPQELEELVTLSIPVNIYQVYEIVSDNLAIGLGRPMPSDYTFSKRHHLMQTFNQAMVKRLQGYSTGSDDLESLRTRTGISIFAQSLSESKHCEAAQYYLKHFPHVPMDQLEYAVWPLLVANMESSVDTVAMVASYQVGSIVREGFIRRYDAITTLLSGVPLTLQQRIDVSTHAILVVPIFAYYLGILCEKVRSLDNWYKVIEEQTLYDALYLAAQQIRLLNDLGTGLMTQTAAEQETFLQSLYDYALRDPSADLAIILEKMVHDSDALLTRIAKDMNHGEFNLGFTDLLQVTPTTEALRKFGKRLEHYTALYKRNKTKFAALLDTLTETLQDSVTSTVLHTIVAFHEHMYSNLYHSKTGEYAI